MCGDSYACREVALGLHSTMNCRQSPLISHVLIVSLLRGLVVLVLVVNFFSQPLRAQETLRLFWSTAGLIDPNNNNGFTTFPAIGADPILPDAQGPRRLYLWANFEGGGQQDWNIITFNVDFIGDFDAEILARDFWSLTTSFGPRWSVHDDGVLNVNTLTGVTMIATPPFSYGATNNATIMVHDPHWDVGTQVVLLGWVEFIGSGTVHLSVGAGAIQQLDGETDSVKFGWGDAAISGSVVGLGSAVHDAVIGDCILDSDGDGAVDCEDGCPLDPAKTVPGGCGCGVPETDSDSDGILDCVDACPNDPLKGAPETCGCGQLEIDSDGDGAPDCIDACPNDPMKINPGPCGCGTEDSLRDADHDGIPDCVDGCPLTPNKVGAGDCGCSSLDPDLDGNGIADCIDVVLSPVCPEPTRYCPASVNSSGIPGEMTVRGSLQLAEDNLFLGATGLPPGVLCVLYSGANVSLLPLGSGTLCVAPVSRHRLAMASSPLGTVEFPIDFGQLKLVSGSTRSFQIVFRDGGTTNTTDAIRGRFCP